MLCVSPGLRSRPSLSEPAESAPHATADGAGSVAGTTVPAFVERFRRWMRQQEALACRRDYGPGLR